MLAMIAEAVTAPTPGMVRNKRTRASSLATSLRLQLRMEATFPMSDGGGGLVFAAPSRPIPDEGDGQYWPQQEASDQVTDFRCGQGISKPEDHAASG
ncbi:hypothetical protein ACSSV4_004637 [Roseovarius sp. MBR-154]|uniref:hypothetical protein n=1 Tax=Roseobacteraceae TaxID=2854170 RepID=UPI001587674E|nr:MULTISPECIES: hypothetical protein [Roseobacteraceae]